MSGFEIVNLDAFTIMSLVNTISSLELQSRVQFYKKIWDGWRDHSAVKTLAALPEDLRSISSIYRSAHSCL